LHRQINRILLVINLPPARCGRPNLGYFDMEIYKFEIVKGDSVVSAKSAVAIRDFKSIWPIITEMAQGPDMAGCKIRVTDETGAIVILTGVATARLHAGTTIFSAPLFSNPALSA
jgi:hypothetical protein